MSEELFRPIFVPDKFREAVSGRARLGAMLEAEGALAHAEAQAGLIPPDAAEAIASRCDAGLFDPEELGRRGRAQGNPVPPLVRVLTEAVSEASQDAARYVHKGATSQDIVDTAAMLLARRALDLILVELDEISKACARLAYAHRETIMVGRTLLQQALPTTFGLKAAGWLVSVLEAKASRRALIGSGCAAGRGSRDAGLARRLRDLRSRGVRAGARSRGARTTVAHRQSPNLRTRGCFIACRRRPWEDLPRRGLDGADGGR
jgi:3-carboxy-cis,cis-muconate cycloisomerase